MAVGNSKDKNATNEQLEISYQAGHCCGLKDLQLGRVFDCFSLLEACITPSDSIRAISQRRGLWATTSPSLPSPMHEVCGIASSRVLPSSSRMH